MARFIKHDKETRGKSPGFLKFTGVQKVEKPIIEITEYHKHEIKKFTVDDVDELVGLKNTKAILWINVIGMHDEKLVEKIGEIFSINPLALEDVLNVGQRPKFEEFAHYSFIAMKALSLNESENEIIQQQMSVIFGRNFLISFLEEPFLIFDPIHERLKNKASKLRNYHADYLAYAIVDATVDNYIYIIEYFGDLIEGLDEDLLSSSSDDVFMEVYEFKKEINYLRKVVRPVRETVLGFIKSENDLLLPSTKPFLKDLQDHVTHASEIIEVYRDLLSDQLNFHNAQANNKLNDIIRILTIFSVIFIPLTFVAGVYGTNFEFIPELGYKYAYPIFWFALIMIAMGMYMYFKRKKWL